MKSRLLLGLMLALPLATFAACSSDDDTTNDSGGAGGASAGRGGNAGSGGRAGSNGRAGNTGNETAGAAGESTTGGSSGGGSETAGAGGDATDEAGAGGAAGAVAALDDAQILKVLSTANEGEVSVAQVAKPSLQSSAALNFAQMMIDEHTAANGQTLALVSSKHLAPEPSDVSEKLEADAATVISALSSTAPATFDKVYIVSQVSMHQEVLGLIDTRLLPDANDSDLKALLATLRTSVAAHLATAQSINASLP